MLLKWNYRSIKKGWEWIADFMKLRRRYYLEGVKGLTCGYGRYRLLSEGNVEGKGDTVLNERVKCLQVGNIRKNKMVFFP